MNFKNILSKYTKVINIEIRGINILIHYLVDKILRSGFEQESENILRSGSK